MNNNHETHSCCKKTQKTDYFFWGTVFLVALGYFSYVFNLHFNIEPIEVYNSAIYEIINQMWWGVVAGILFVGILELVPKDAVNKLLGSGNGTKGIIRAAFAGILFDLCSHGILLVAMKLYKKGVSLPQVMAFLIASPWNSISLTIILIALIGLKWTALFIVISFLVAVISGLIFKFLVDKNILPKNPNIQDLPTDIGFVESFKKEYEDKKLNLKFFFGVIKKSFVESEMILRWVFVGVIIAAFVRAFVPDEMFMHYFGASMLGVIMTLIATTIIEVCSEGSVPIAADILNRALAPGNAFVFLMAGVATDYTEIMALKETTGSWKISLFLPLVTVPQIIILGYLLNFMM